MRETLDRMIASIREYFAKMPRRSRIRMAVLAVFVVVLSIVVVSLLTRTKWEVLPGTGDSINPGAISGVLAEIGIPTQTEGLSILVPDNRVQEAVAYLRERGLVGASTFDDYWLSQAASFGVSSEHAKELYDMQMGDFIRTMLLQNPRIQNAFVIIRSGETSPFRIQTNTRKATASVQVTLNDGGMLSAAEAQTIADMVRGALPGVEYEDIVVSDSNLKSYRIGDASQDMEVEFEQRIMFQNRITELAKSQAETLLSPIYGPENMRVQPYVVLNFDKKTTSKVEWDPPIPGNEEGMLRSSEEIYERSRNWAAAEGIPGTDSNALGTAEYPYGDFGPDDYYMRNVIGLNFELNETRTAIEHAQGTIDEFGITVLINSDYMGEGEEAPEYTAEVIDMVSKAIGIPPLNISVQHVPFSYMDTSYQDYLDMLAAREAQERRDMWIDRIFMYGTIFLLAIMFFMLVRSVAKTLRPVPEPEEILIADGPGVGMDIIVGEDEEGEREYEDIDLNAKSAGLEQIARFIDKDPAAVAQLLRNWLTEE